MMTNKKNYRVFAIPAACALGAVLLAAGCGSGGGTSSVALPGTPTPAPSATPISTPSPSPTNGPVSATGRYQDLVFTVTAPKRVYAQGEVVPLTFTVQNTGTNDVFSDYTDLSFTYNGQVRTQDGQLLVSSLEHRNTGDLSSGRLVFKAGETVTYQTQWYGGTDVYPAPTGTYRIRTYLTTGNINGSTVDTVDHDVLTTDYLNIVVQ